MRIIFFICLIFLIVSQYFCFCAIHPDHLAEVVGTIIDETKSKEPKEISKKVITDLEKCAKTKKDAVTKVVLKCLSDIKRPKVDTLTYFSSAAIAFAFETCQIFAIGAFVIWRIFSM